MCNWIEGHTDRFAAIASQRSISNWVADFGASEIGYTFDGNEMGATPWTDMEKMWAQSPLKYACDAKTPILFIHSLEGLQLHARSGRGDFLGDEVLRRAVADVPFRGREPFALPLRKAAAPHPRLTEIMNWFAKYLN